MKAVYFDGTKLSLRDNYPAPKTGEALVKIKFAGICGTDLEIIRGYMSYTGILGHEFVGVVEKSDEPNLVGKRVVGEINTGCGKCDYCSSGL
jgi:threonine dehydrogenase-like Zn-dependent dehydrogenase